MFRVPWCWAHGEVLGAGFETVPLSVDPCIFVGYIHWLTDEYTTLHSSVIGTFLGFGTKEYISVISLGTEEYKKI
jgi:hypothetical protein